jgi:hypothetical protein
VLVTAVRRVIASAEILDHVVPLAPAIAVAEIAEAVLVRPVMPFGEHTGVGAVVEREY